MSKLIPAKLSRPRLFDTTPRERLFAMLDGWCRHPAVWVEGPAGAGKTALVASYLERRGHTSHWFQVDADDGDPASFFYFLSQLPGLAGDPLPAYGVEFAADIPRFARRFFRALYSALGESALVLDNVHEALDSPGFCDALREAVAQAPEGVQLILTSRSEPPGGLSRFAAQGTLVVLGWADLRLDAEEIAAITGLERGKDDAQIAGLETATGGWAAGLTLILARPVDEPIADAGSLDRVYEFLAAEILDATDSAARAVLLSTWPLARITAAHAVALSGEAGAGSILAALYQQNFFLERLPGAEAAYRYHALFRNFLEAQARVRLGGATCSTLEARAGELLEAEGELGEAFTRHRAAGQLADCHRMILAHAPKLASAGRLATLADWLAALPQGADADQPDIDYWRGVCALGRDAVLARAAFAKAADAFAARGQTAASMRAVCGVIDTIYAEWSDFSRLDSWIERATDLLGREDVFADPADELRGVSSTLVALLYRQPRHAQVDALVERTRRVLAEAVSPDERVAAGTYLLNAYNWMGRSADAREVIALVSPVIAQAKVSPLRRAWWWVRLAYHHYLNGAADATLAALAEAREQAREHGFGVVENIVELYAAFHYLSEAQWALARAAVEAYESRLNPERHLDYAIASYQRAWLAMASGNQEEAQDRAARAVQLARRAGVPNVEAYFLLLDTLLAARDGDSKKRIDAARTLTDGARFPLFAFTADLVEAEILLDAWDVEAAVRRLKAGLALGARHDYGNSLLWRADAMAGLCGLALERGVEPDYVARLITRRKLAPPGSQISAWPWPLRIYTLGPFRVVHEGQPLVFTRKAQKKPLAVLMALVALGGQSVSAARIAEVLWPDAEGDAARAALNTALYRLRQLLETEEAITVADGKLSLDPRLVWVDRWAFEALDAASAGVSATARLFELYRGHFLEQEEEAPWLIAPRNALKARFEKGVECLGQALEAEGRDDEAVAIYERGIALDMLAEGLYRRLMQCHARCGQVALALEAYRRCRQSLSVVLGVAPSAQTEAIHRTLRS